VEGHYKAFALPDNAHTGMGVSFLEAYSNHTSQVNLNRGFDSVGGMVTNIPTGDAEVDGKAHAKLRVDKTNEAWKGDAGGWSGHPAFSPYVREPFDIVRGIHKGFKLVAARGGGRAPLEAAIAQVDPAAATAEAALQPVLAVIDAVAGENEKEKAALANLKTQLAASLTLHVAKASPEQYRDGLVRFIDLSPPLPPVTDAELIAVPAEQHAPDKFTYAGLKQYLRLALFYTAAFVHGTGCIALDGVFEDLATAEKARANVWQWLAFDQPLLMPDGTTATASPALLEQAMEEVYATALGAERELWGKVCKSLAPMQPDELGEKHFRVARKVLMVLCASDRPLEFIPDLAYPFLLEPVRADAALWEELYANLDVYMDPMASYAQGAAAVKA
jgi:malate synthase